jgi:4'-phosphopantetheinyl transferase
MEPTLQLYRANLDIAAVDGDRFWQWLSADEQKRANRFKREPLKRNFVAARGNLREILAQHLGCEPQDLQFGYGDRGKPHLKNAPIHFNLAHSQDLAIYAVSCDRELGIDLEYLNLRCDVEEIANRYFVSAEKQIIRDLADQPDQQSLAFYRAWTLKEAYGKATGQGIANLLDRVDVSPLLQRPMGEVWQIDGWQLQLLSTELSLDANYAAALCIRA